VKLTYQTKPQISDFTYYLIWDDEKLHGEYLRKRLVQPALDKIKEQYNFVFKEIKKGELPDDSNFTYVLFGPTNPLKFSAEEKTYLKRLSSLAEAKVNVISVYQDDNAEIENVDIPKVAQELGINIIYPDNLIEDIKVRTVDQEDIKDNIVCETIRVKYEPVFDESISENELRTIKDEYEDDIEVIRTLYKKYCLWHRASTDGAVAIQTKKGVLVSQTRTGKNSMTTENFSLVTGFFAETNQIIYSGNKIPSSDSPEFLVFLNFFKQRPKYLIHFHKNEVIRNPKFEEHLTKEKIEYGKFESGEKMFRELNQAFSNSLLLREHGIVWWGDELSAFTKYVEVDLGIKS